MSKKYFENLCVKALTKEITDVEHLEFQKLLNESEKNRSYFEQLKQTWNNSDPNSLKYDLSIDEDWNILNNKLNVDQPLSNKGFTAKIWESVSKPIFKPALAFGSIIIIFMSILIFNNIENEDILKSAITGNGEHKEVILSDGSVVKLNNGSELKYFEKFTDEMREVTLTGEAFFSIKKDGRPFIIKTENATTKVLGTKFNVWARENKTRIIVTEGKVSLADNSLIENKVILEKDQTSSVIGNNRPTMVKKIDVNYNLGWLDGKLIFNNTNLDELVGELERFYNTEIQFDIDNSFELKLTGSFQNEEIQSVLTKICLALNLEYVEEQNGYIIKNQ